MFEILVELRILIVKKNVHVFFFKEFKNWFLKNFLSFTLIQNPFCSCYCYLWFSFISILKGTDHFWNRFKYMRSSCLIKLVLTNYRSNIYLKCRILFYYILNFEKLFEFNWTWTHTDYLQLNTLLNTIPSVQCIINPIITTILKSFWEYSIF